MPTDRSNADMGEKLWPIAKMGRLMPFAQINQLCQTSPVRGHGRHADVNLSAHQ